MVLMSGDDLLNVEFARAIDPDTNPRLGVLIGEYHL
jgi:hypothetical protein